MDNKLKKIMVVDDEDDLIFLLQILLEQKGYKVNAFTDPLLALQSFKAGIYDLAILDIKLPSLNGFDLYERIKRIDDFVKVCFFTASDEDLKTQKYSRLRKKVIIIRKPISNEELLKKVDEAINTAIR
jgi:DNA-binding response OmpR family regulator